MGPEARLRSILQELPGAVVAYSGGADSAYLADVAHEVLGARMVAVTAVSPSLARAEREHAAGVARARGWAHEEIATDELERADYRENRADRCFHCKDTLFDALESLAERRSSVVLVGTNLDDTGDFRPGQRAAREHGVRAPLLEAGLTKDEIRAHSRARGLPTWDKPASACLASRIAYGIEVTAERLERVERAEAYLRSLGFVDMRVRDHGELSRIEVQPADVERVAGAREAIAARFKELGFTWVTLDLEGFRSGSMNDALLRIQRKGD